MWTAAEILHGGGAGSPTSSPWNILVPFVILYFSNAIHHQPPSSVLLVQRLFSVAPGKERGFGMAVRAWQRQTKGTGHLGVA